MDAKKKNTKERLVALIARYGHLDHIITVAAIAAAAVLALAVGIVLIVNATRDEQPVNAVFDEDGHLTAVLGEHIVCLDPGHGYDDPGTDSDYLGEDWAEREVNLDVALRARTLLEGYGITVVMTREQNGDPGTEVPTDDAGLRTIDPVWRADFANELPLELYVSLHCDSFTANEAVSGTRIYYMPTAQGGSEAGRLAQRCGKTIRQFAGGDEVAIKPMNADDAFYVIKHVRVPSVLIEMGFVTNPADAEKMLDEGWRQKMAEGVAQGIVDYILYH